jgi:hypothetical protein
LHRLRADVHSQPDDLAGLLSRIIAPAVHIVKPTVLRFCSGTCRKFDRGFEFQKKQKKSREESSSDEITPKETAKRKKEASDGNIIQHVFFMLYSRAFTTVS